MAAIQVVYPAIAKSALKALHLQAKQRGIEARFLLALQTIDARLHADPRNFGEELFSYQYAKLRIRHGICNPVVAYWAVHDELDLVFLRDFKLLSS